ncbi:hypothetical protein L218DRAFT_961875 [Marasmius fiardii PR-910]|nr:hypothetical protein L218DRAFT_961875 [Marasmius fiardii PR-910]
MGTGALLQGEGIRTSTSNHGHGGQYDQSLLAEAPTSTKQMRQEGYDPAILKAPSPVNRTALENRDLESGLSTGASKERLAAVGGSGASPTPTPRPVPFFRTKKGVAVIIVAVLVVIGVVIGGAVGGTRKKSKPNDVVSNPGATVGNGGGGGSGSGSGIEGSPEKGAGGGNGSSSAVGISPASTSANGNGVVQAPTSTSSNGNPVGIGTPTGGQQQTQATGTTGSNGGVQKPPVGIVGFSDSIVRVEAGLPL